MVREPYALRRTPAGPGQEPAAWALGLLAATLLAGCTRSDGPPPGTGDGGGAVERAEPGGSADGGIASGGERADGTASEDGRPREIAEYVLRPGQSLDVIESEYPDGKPLLRREVLRDADGMMNHGHFQRWHPNGMLAEEGWYLLGQKQGTYLIVAETGIKQSEVTYDHGRRQGPSKTWTEVGRPIERANYVDDQLDGEYELHHVPGGVLKERGTYQAGKRVGTWGYWLPNGVQTREETFRDGLLDGPTVEWDEAGHKVADRSYVAGVPDGLQVEYYPEGAVQSEARYSAGRLEGLQRRWYPDGTLQVEGEMRDGKREGHWTYYETDGTVNEGWTGEYRNDVRVSD